MAAIDLFVVCGQSNAEGRGNQALSPATTAGLAVEYTGAALEDPLDDPVGGATSGSAWPAFCNAYTATCGRAVCITEAAVGGTALLEDADSGNGNWSANDTLFDDAVTRANNALAALSGAGWTPTLRGILWHQGERDAQGYPTPATLEADYAAALDDLHDRFIAELGAVRFYVFRVGRPNSGDSAPWVSVRAAQDTVCAARSDMAMVYTNCVNFPGLGWMADDLHYTQAGYNDMGAEGGEAVALDLADVFVFNIAKGRTVELYNRVKSNDPATSALVVVPLSAVGLEAQGQDFDTLAAVLADSNFDEQTGTGWQRAILTDADLAAMPSPDDTLDRYTVQIPAANLGAPTVGNAVGFLVCYDPDTTSGDDTGIVPLVCTERAVTADGNTVLLAAGDILTAA